MITAGSERHLYCSGQPYSRLLPRQDKHNPAAEAVKITTTGAFMRRPHDGQPTSPAAQNKADHGVLFLGLLYLSRALYILQTPRGESSLACFHTSPINSPQQMKRAESFSSSHLFCIFKSISKWANLSRINKGGCTVENYCFPLTSL